MPDFKNLSDLAKWLDKQTKDAMKNEVAKKVIEVEKKHIQTDVYEVYPDPVQYERTYKLIADESFVVRETSDGVYIRNIRHDEETGKDIAYTIISGQGYDYFFPYYDKPRDFEGNAAEELRENDAHVEALKQGLKRLGINVV